MPILEVKSVTKKFPTPKGEVIAVNNVSFSANSGEVLGILGPNGAGKTTTLRMIATIYRPDSGEVLVDGIDAVKNPLEVRKRIAYMTQEPDLTPPLSVRDYIIYYFRFRGFSKRDAKKHCEDILELFGLKTHAHKKPFQLSTGLKRRVQLACALSSDVPLVFLDEPTAGVDPRSKRKTWELIKEKLEDKGVTVILTSHDLYEVEYLADRVIIMNQGKIVAEGSPKELKKRFGKTVRIVLEEPIKNFELLKEELLRVKNVKDVRLARDDSFDVYFKSLDDSINGILQVISPQELKIKDIFTATANFEDVYLEIIER
ncbi:ABC transporter ATP-binding protein [Pyrococcus abyssi]|uniref:Daunorubicin resistance atp-binding protein drra n=1 Tax=Pyrococcus abyssi (strain GE5 / Orsay) TaxID=272844 RepID=Q9UZZ5_PYRAB|nr:ABC transporter ATP-binding protein [Pyrococcus abyssi]CAB49911.1 ABC-type multidrug transporter, ATPase component, substrate unknown [Pyrococcus abyssi GE5]CCE70409.1 TPA: daunorubicin resistance atp-binding protein drra [Pyrococcus abyssi GE5]